MLSLRAGRRQKDAASGARQTGQQTNASANGESSRAGGFLEHVVSARPQEKARG
jgi:hypothetical protein